MAGLGLELDMLGDDDDPAFLFAIRVDSAVLLESPDHAASPALSQLRRAMLAELRPRFHVEAANLFFEGVALLEMPIRDNDEIAPETTAR